MNEALTVADVLRSAMAEIGDCSPSPRADVELLLCHVLGWGRGRLFTRDRETLPPESLARFRDLLGRRRAGEPVAYITGRRGFWTLELQVDTRALIPRPETELLVERALQLLPSNAARVADLGTGSGAIALALASERPDWTMVATDRSPDSLTLARANGERLGLVVDWRQGDWLSPLAGDCFDLIVSNPPYVASGDPHLVQGDLRFEPAGALAAGAEGLDEIRRIVAAAPGHLTADGWLLLEHGHEQGQAVRDLLGERGFHQITTYRDLAGHPRATEARAP